MRESNKYQKYYGEYQKLLTRTTYDEVLQPFRFNYVKSANKSEIKNLFPNFQFKGNSTTLITQDNRVTELTEKDRVIIDGSKSIVTSITSDEVQGLGGQRFKDRKKTYLIELEV